MEHTTIRVHKKIKMKDPILIEGLPGIGLVGKIAADHVLKEWRAKKIATIYSPHFPPQVLMRKNGVVRMLRMRIYHKKKNRQDYVFLVGDIQASTPPAHYEICDAIIEYFKSLGGKKMITLGGYGTGKSRDRPRVFGAASSKKVIPEYKKKGIMFGQTRGSIVGAAGLLLGMGRLKGIHGVCLMGETHGGYVDPKSALVLIDSLAKVLEVKISTKDLEKKVKLGEAFVKKMEQKAAKAQGITARAGSVNDLSYIR